MVKIVMTALGYGFILHDLYVWFFLSKAYMVALYIGTVGFNYTSVYTTGNLRVLCANLDRRSMMQLSRAPLQSSSARLPS